MVNFILTEPVYGFEIHCYVGDQQACFKHASKKFSIDFEYHCDSAGKVVPLADKNNSLTAVILWVESLKYTPTSMAYLAHEALHVTQEVMVALGIPVHTGEAPAYYMDYIVENFISTYRQLSTKKGKKR